MHAHHAVVGAQTRKDLLRLGLLRPIEFRKQASGGPMDRIEGLLPNVEHPVHHVPSFLPWGGAHCLEHGLVGALHLAGGGGERIGVAFQAGCCASVMPSWVFRASR
jgi:hypothetical protein